MRFFLILLISLVFNTSSTGQERQETILTDDWKFSLGANTEAMDTSFDDSTWAMVNVPHDWAINQSFILNENGDTGKLPWKNEGWYRKSLDIDKANQGKRIYLLFDGAMSFPEVYLNGKFIGKWDYGYNSFYLDITEAVLFDHPNILAVHCNTKAHDSRWYPGGGLFRKVTMIITNPIHVNIWGTYITTPNIEVSSATVQVETTITNASKEKAFIDINYSIVDSDNKIAAQQSKSVSVSDYNEQIFKTEIAVPDPKLWDIESPERYHLLTEIRQNGQRIDQTQNQFWHKRITFYRR